MIKILFLIHDLGQGGAEKVLVNLVNNLDRSKFDITVMSLFGGGVNEQFLKKEVRYLTVFRKDFPGNSKVMKLFSPKRLHQWFIKEHYDIEISYLEGPSARIISGCRDPKTQLVTWIHCTETPETFSKAFRSREEALQCYRSFNRVVCVSEGVRKAFLQVSGIADRTCVLYNVFDTETIRRLSDEATEELTDQDGARLVAIGSLSEGKGYQRLLKIMKRLSEEGTRYTLFILGKGPLLNQLEQYVEAAGIKEQVRFLGYQTNPYRILAKSDLFICPSFAEGFSTAIAEALIVGTPICTTDVSGVKELLGEDNQYGIVVENNEEALYQGIRLLLNDPKLLDHYRGQAKIRGKKFSTEQTVKAVEEFLFTL